MSKEHERDLGKSLLKSVTMQRAAEVATEAAEIAFDQGLAEGLLKEIPVFGWILKGYGAIVNIRDRVFLKKVAQLLKGTADITAEEKAAFSRQLEKEPDRLREIGENLILLIERSDHFDKPYILGQLFKAYIRDQVSREDLERLAVAIDRALVSDLRAIIATSDGSISSELLERLYKVDLAKLSLYSGLRTTSDMLEELTVGSSKPKVSYRINDLGEKLKMVLRN